MNHSLRLLRLERYVDEGPDLIAQHAYDAAWSAAVDAIACTMSDEHLELVTEEFAAREAAGCCAPWTVPSGPRRRLASAFQSRIVARVGSGPEIDVPARWPDRPLALPPQVAAVYMQQDLAVGLHVFEWKECAECRYAVPVLGRAAPGDGVSKWRYEDPFDHCPLCGGPIVTPTNWYDGLGVMQLALREAKTV